MRTFALRPNAAPRTASFGRRQPPSRRFIGNQAACRMHAGRLGQDRHAGVKGDEPEESTASATPPPEPSAPPKAEPEPTRSETQPADQPAPPSTQPEPSKPPSTLPSTPPSTQPDPPSSQPAAPTITSETTFAAPDGSAKTRTDIGVGEEVKFTGSASGKWTATDGKPLTLASGTTFTWTAPERAKTVTIK